ncbi:pyridoxamine 5'-phosphate oxidase family protein [Furfurilactobacillus sp. WILCCON 0119]|uniref:pyridoxamine 5'-phosphate oxidase family protein n=1 Tax=Furfurilactobacillus entadae TaxID=2922307 RepID=UPI0035EB0D30
MAKLTAEMKELVDKAFPFIATVDAHGNPQIGPKGTLRVLDDEHLIYNEETGRHAWQNLQDNGKIAVAVHPYPGLKGIRVEGHATIYTDGKIFDDAKQFATDNKLPDLIAAVVISVDRIIRLDAGPDAGTEIANSPVKD